MLREARAIGCLLSSACYIQAVAGGHCEVLKFLREEACEYDCKAAHAAARIGNIRYLEIMYEICIEQHGWWISDIVCALAVESGRIAVLKKAWELQPATYNVFIYEDPLMGPMQLAAYRGRIDMMKWLLNNGCPWGSSTCQAIADVGDPAVSKWAAEAPNGCRCNSPFGITMTSQCSVHGDPWI